ncbi:hypothetical protein MTO96_033327 [Rhipicephalus appendiculatus]
MPSPPHLQQATQSAKQRAHPTEDSCANSEWGSVPRDCDDRSGSTKILSSTDFNTAYEAYRQARATSDNNKNWTPVSTSKPPGLVACLGGVSWTATTATPRGRRTESHVCGERQHWDCARGQKRVSFHGQHSAGINGSMLRWLLV